MPDENLFAEFGIGPELSPAGEGETPDGGAASSEPGTETPAAASSPMEGDSPSAEGSEGQQVSGQQVEGQSAEGQTPAGAAPATPAEVAEDPEKVLLRQQVQALLAAQGQNAQQVQQAQQTAPAGPDFSYNIPQELTQLIHSEDPAERTQGLGLFAQGIAQTVYQQAVQAAQVQNQQQLQATLTAQAQAQHVRQDFYGKYPELDRPELHPVVQSVGQQLAQQMGLQGWTPELRDAIGARIKALLAPAPAPQPQPQLQPQAGRGGGGVGQGRPAAGKTLGDQILELAR